MAWITHIIISFFVDIVFVTKYVTQYFQVRDYFNPYKLKIMIINPNKTGLQMFNPINKKLIFVGVCHAGKREEEEMG